jgi:hypothetical protein
MGGRLREVADHRGGRVTTMTWDEALTRIEQDVWLAEVFLADDVDPPTSTWSPPADLGPMPPSLAGRARDLVARAKQVKIAVQARMDALAAERAQLDVRRTAMTAYVTADQGE